MEKKEIKKQFRMVRKYMQGQLEHLGHHCCSINPEEYNFHLDLLYELEGELLDLWKRKH